MSRLRVLVCGGRNYADKDKLFHMLDYLNESSPEEGIDVIIQGGCTGADSLAREWAFKNTVPWLTYGADFKSLGPVAGPMRNRFMLAHSKPDIVVVFPGGKGTKHMRDIAYASPNKLRIIEA